jgi:esterase
MREHLQEEGVIQFLLKSFVDGQWRFNVPVLWEQYPHIVGWQTVPPGRIRRCLSRRQLALRHRCLPRYAAGAVPRRGAHVIAGAGTGHAEKPEAVLRAIRRYLTEHRRLTG